ncbi:hypothetical protein [Bartonella tribocorum]|uniref:Uncharacterized protein n=1 Tax=Bartonella tribocorum TaxID=85701 RepID=A0A2M6UTE9_9HYPH|nr:hypothetical protein [Bartonella tribocorum]PIT69473.1 hypothetical protein CER18_03380 [Bartonella tribocorum]
MKKINIAIDVLPYKHNIWSICDYSGEQVYHKCALPLFCVKNGTPICIGARDVEQNEKELTISIKENLFWNNGEQVYAEDYVRAIDFIQHDEGNRYQKILSSLPTKKSLRKLMINTVSLYIQNIMIHSS